MNDIPRGKMTVVEAPNINPLVYVSFIETDDDGYQAATGWATVNFPQPITCAEHIEAIAEHIREMQGATDIPTILSFQRLEPE